MLINRQQLINTLDILSAPHQKVIENFEKKNPSDSIPMDEVVIIMNARNALTTYNSLKQKYQPSV